MKKIIILIIIISNFSSEVICQNILSLEDDNIFEEDKTSISELFHTFLTSQELLITKPFINFSTGFSDSFLPAKLHMDNMPRTNNFTFEYGFLLLDTNSIFPQIIDYSSQFAYIESNTNKYGFFKRNKLDLYDNQFNFGVGLRSGLGYQTDAYELYLLHTSSFLWGYFDYDVYEASSFFNAFDNRYKFGWRGSAGLEFRFTKHLLLGFSYEHSNIYSGFEFLPWAGSWLVDNILQRWIDLLDPVFIKEIGYSYPLLKFLYKNTVSIVMSEIRNIKQYYPFNSDYSLLHRKLSINLKLFF